MTGAVGGRWVVGVGRWLWVSLAVVVLAGCTLRLDSSPPPQSYLLDGSGFSSPMARRSSGKTLLVTAPKAAPGFDSKQIAYIKEPLKLDYYNDSVWSDTPSKMLLPILVRAFEGTGAFKAVIAPPAPTLADMRVDVDVIRLQQEFMTQPSRVRLTARIKVLSMRNGHVLATQVFEVFEPAPSEDAYGAARAANVAVQKLLGDMIPFALRYLG